MINAIQNDRAFERDYPNFAIIKGGVEAINRHHRRCMRLVLPYVSVRKVEKYARIYIDFVNLNEYALNAGLGVFLSNFVKQYWARRSGHRERTLYRGDKGEGSRVDIASFYVLMKDLYPVAAKLMPIINDRRNWVEIWPQPMGQCV